jgi:hypothetical protein
LGQVFLISTPAKVARVWFPETQKALATTIVALAVPLGSIAGFAIPSAFVSDHEDWTEDNKELTRHQINKYILWQNIIITVCAVPIIAFIKTEPKNPPSVAAAKFTPPEHFFAGTATLFKDRNYIFILISYTCIMAI